MKGPRVAVIGAGYWGPNVVRNLNEAPGAFAAGTHISGIEPARA